MPFYFVILTMPARQHAHVNLAVQTRFADGVLRVKGTLQE